MAACPADTFSNVTDAVFKCLVAKAAKYGVTINKDSGTAKSNGFTVKWNYDRAASNLTIQVTDSPFWAPCATIRGVVKKEVQSCM